VAGLCHRRRDHADPHLCYLHHAEEPGGGTRVYHLLPGAGAGGCVQHDPGVLPPRQAAPDVLHFFGGGVFRLYPDPVG